MNVCIEIAVFVETDQPEDFKEELAAKVDEMLSRESYRWLGGRAKATAGRWWEVSPKHLELAGALVDSALAKAKRKDNG